MDIAEIQDELLRLEYPNLLPDHDPDIERYYYLRSTGQSMDALNIYNNRLRVRYPDDFFRTWLLRSYRQHNPSFRSLLAKGYRMLASRSLERVRKIIDFIADLSESFNEKDVYSTIKTAEDIIRFLPRERFEAIAGMERFLRYATVLNVRVGSIARAAELVRAYLTDTLAIVEKERRRRTDEQRRMEEAERKRLVQADWDSYYYQKKYGVHIPLIDLSSVVFSQDDLARIEIPPFRRVEDQILGYCIKYWNMVNDPAFERILFLYSRKYGRKNYDVFAAIRRGKMGKQRDDEILASIMGILVTGYYYSVQGDLYLQRNWNAIKYALANQSLQPAKYKALPAPEQKPAKKAKTKRSGAKKFLAPKPKSGAKIAPASESRKKPPAVIARPASVPRTIVPAGKVTVPRKLKPAEETKTTIVTPAPAAQPRPVQQPPPRPAIQSAPRPQQQPSPKPVRPAPAAQPCPAQQPPPRPAIQSAPRPQQQPSTTPARPAPSAQPRPEQQPPPRPAIQSAPRPAQQPSPKPARPAPTAQPRSAQQPAPRPAIQSTPRPQQQPQSPTARPTPAAQPRPIQPETPRPVVPPGSAPRQPMQPPRPAVQSAPPAQSPRPAAQSAPSAAQIPVQPKPSVNQGYRPAPLLTRGPPPPPRPQKTFTTNLEKARGSVSDRLKKLAGRSYDVYQDRFHAKSRNAIRKVLGAGKGLFFNLPEEAEDLVFNFLRDHYSDPYMDWEKSPDRKNLLVMGFDLPSLEPVIDECYRTL
ncbi:MAG: hypothetical protein LBJ31_10835 [Treponema sp.]|jgi:hypothetical protein|nr:hypothetical protein [Treponema sp.]